MRLCDLSPDTCTSTGVGAKPGLWNHRLDYGPKFRLDFRTDALIDDVHFQPTSSVTEPSATVF